MRAAERTEAAAGDLPNAACPVDPTVAATAGSSPGNGSDPQRCIVKKAAFMPPFLNEGQPHSLRRPNDVEKSSIRVGLFLNKRRNRRVFFLDTLLRPVLAFNPISAIMS
jgi:hypothetical protein